MTGQGETMIQKQTWLLTGLEHVRMPQSGMRTESLRYLRAGGFANPRYPIMVEVSCAGIAHIVDGRHRITVARERGERWVTALVLGVGPRGGVRWRYAGRIRI